jgi:hypothetical protein
MTGNASSASAPTEAAMTPAAGASAAPTRITAIGNAPGARRSAARMPSSRSSPAPVLCSIAPMKTRSGTVAYRISSLSVSEP